MSLLLWALPLQWSTLPSKHPRLQSSSGLSPQPPSACFLGWLSKLQIPAPRPCAQLRTPLSGWGALAAAWTLCADLAPSCQPQAKCCAISKSLTHPPVSAALLTVKGLLQMWKSWPYLQLPSRSRDLILPPLLFLSPSFFYPARLYGNHAFPFMCLKSSASIQQVLCENFSVFDVFLMYLWREMNMFSCPSTILGSLYWFFSLVYLYLLWSFISSFCSL